MPTDAQASGSGTIFEIESNEEESRGLITWPNDGTYYRIEVSTNLKGWDPATESETFINDFINWNRYVQLPENSNRGFYRLIEAPTPPLVIPTSPGQYDLQLIHNGLQRDFFLQIPATYIPNPAQPTELVFIFHGSGQNIATFSNNHPDLFTEANTKNMILVLPQAKRIAQNSRTWQAFDPVAHDDAPAGEPIIDDVAFIDALLTELKSALTIDDDRVFAAGFSNGGVLVHYMLGRLDGTFKAGAAVGSSISSIRPDGVEIPAPDKPTTATSFLVVNGKEDAQRPFNGGENVNGSTQAAAFESRDHWIEANGGTGSVPGPINPAPTITRFPPGVNNVTREAYALPNGIRVNFDILDDSNHTWPDAGDSYQGNPINYDANLQVLNFFDLLP